MLREVAVAEDVAVVPGHSKNGNALSARLQRHDGPLLLGKLPGRAQELQDIVLALLQLIAQFGCQHVRPGHCTAAGRRRPRHEYPGCAAPRATLAPSQLDLHPVACDGALSPGACQPRDSIDGLGEL